MDGQLTREPANPFAIQGRDAGAVAQRSNMDVEVARGVAEIQGAMVIAKKFPRDNIDAYNKIMRACERPTLAERATYTYPKGDKSVVGPSIRLAEAIAQLWGNIRFAVDELEQHDGYSIVRAYAWDVETNTFVSKTFTVNHEVGLKGGKKKILTDPRDIYELCANQGARRMRACILAVIPGDVVEGALEKCNQTLAKKDGGVPLINRIRKMVAAFEPLGVTGAMIERRFKHKLDVITEQEMVVLRGIYTSLTDGEGKVEQYFDAAEPSQTPKDLETKQPETGATPPSAESPKEPASKAEAAPQTSEAQNSPASTAPAGGKGKKAKAADKEQQQPSKEEPAKAATTPPAESKPSALDRLKNVMALTTATEGDVIAYVVREQGAPGVMTLEELGEAAHEWIFQNWETVEVAIHDFKESQKPQQ